MKKIKKFVLRHKTLSWFIVFAFVFVVENSIFGWNYEAESELEEWMDMLWAVPLYLAFIHLIADQIAERFLTHIDNIINP